MQKIKELIRNGVGLGSKPQSAPSFERNVGKISYTYQDSGEYGRFINNCRLAAWMYVIDRYGIDRSSILDVGCSYGSWAENYQMLGFEKLIGIDPNGDAIERAAQVFDEVRCAYASELGDLYSDVMTMGSNGVVVHILEDESVVKFLKDVSGSLAKDGYLIYSVLNAEYNLSTGRGDWVGENSCVRSLEKQKEYAELAGLALVDAVGTYIEPWSLRDLEFLAHERELRDNSALYLPFENLANFLRGRSLAPYSEVLFVTQVKSQE
jgi:SAM-dependent methyltransferase